MEVTLKDIAKEVGVSISTVSRAMNLQDRNGSDIQKKIQETAKAMGYADKKAMILSNMAKPAFSIGCLFTSEHESIVSPFFAELHRGIMQEAKKLSPYADIKLTTLNIPSIETLSQNSFDGVIILGRTKRETIADIRKTVAHCVYAGLNPIPGIDNVISDIKEGIGDIVKHLGENGRRNIGFIGPVSIDSATFNEYRYDAYLSAMKRLSLPVSPTLVKDSYLDASDGYDATLAMLDSGGKPDAIVCGNDNLAIGVMKALVTRGISVPKEVALAGYDNIPDSAYLTPSLTTVDVPKADIGKHALLLLLDAIESGRDYPITMTLPHTLLVRESTKEVSR
jgi:DNA-binding LacI/PurR family transcriptional regulator